MNRCSLFNLSAITVVIAASYAAAWALNPAKAGSEEPSHLTTTLVTIADARSGIAQGVDLGKPGDSPGDIFAFDQPLLDSNHEMIGKNSEPPRDCRRLVGLSYAAMGILSMAAVAA